MSVLFEWVLESHRPEFKFHPHPFVPAKPGGNYLDYLNLVVHVKTGIIGYNPYGY
jgi:hypothetical protein